MAETIIKGYLINKINYHLNDEIITFIGVDGIKYTCISLGSKKINSKNARNLFIGSLIEFEFFKARRSDKISKLKKCHIIESIDWKMEQYTPFNLLCECVNKEQSYDSILFDFYKTLLDLVKKDEYCEEEKILIILHKFCIINGISLHVDSCIECNSPILKTISFKKHGMLCNVHFDRKADKLYDLNLTKLFFYLFKNKYSELKKYHSQFKNGINLLKTYIQDNVGIYLSTLNSY